MKSTHVLRAHLRTFHAETAQDSEGRCCPGRVRRSAEAAAQERSLHGGGQRGGPPRAVPGAATRGFHRMCPLGNCENLPGELTQSVLRRAASDDGAGSPDAEICTCDSVLMRVSAWRSQTYAKPNQAEITFLLLPVTVPPPRPSHDPTPPS